MDKTVKEYAKNSKLAERTIREHCQKGKLNATKTGKKWIIHTSQAVPSDTDVIVYVRVLPKEDPLDGQVRASNLAKKIPYGVGTKIGMVIEACYSNNLDRPLLFQAIAEGKKIYIEGQSIITRSDSVYQSLQKLSVLAGGKIIEA